MLAHYGFFLLFTCCLITGYGTLAAIGAANWRHRRLWRSSRMAMTVSLVLVTTASAMMWYFLFEREFSIYYVYKNSSSDLPWIYTITAFWSSLEGSHLLWTLLLNIFGALALWVYADDNEHIMPYVSAILQAVLCWMFYLAISHSDPFQVTLPAPPEGNGMNTLLQNPYMAIHPPLLFIGYTTLAIPFAYAIATLCYGDVTEGWLRTVRRWTLIAFIALSAALTLGGRWAYVELGWAGYWAWDPVENSSFLPWLCATALLHALLVQEKLGQLKRLSIVLAIAGFFMTFMGTFITRSGVISSVHSFAESPIGPNYLAFLAGLLLISILIYGFRAQSILPPETDKVWGVSKESALVITQFLLISFGVIVFIGTIFPVISEAVSGQKISIQAPYFNAFAPYFGLAIVMAIAVGNLMRYQSDKIPNGGRIMLTAAAAAIPLTALLVWLGDIMRTPDGYALGAQLVGTYMVCWTFGCLSYDLYERAKSLRFNWSALFKFNAAYVGAYLAHVGLLICMIGFIGNYRGIEKEASLAVGETTEIYGYQIQFEERVLIEEHDNAQAFVAPLIVSWNGKKSFAMRPAQRKYPTSTEMTNEIAVAGTFWHDLYIVLAGIDKTTGERVTLKINVNPTVKFVWLGVIIICLGGLCSLWDRRRGLKSRDAVAGEWELSREA